MQMQIQSMIDAYKHVAGRPHYHYPDDVIIEDEDGKKVARLAMSLSFATEKPCIFEPGEIEALKHAFMIVWERGRERYRNQEREKFLSSHPTVMRERQVWSEFLSLKGIRHDQNPYSMGITPTCNEYVQWREPRLRELAIQSMERHLFWMVKI
jgi:hypothetical protein